MTGGRAADIADDVGGAVSMFGGDIRGRNVELVPGKRVVQAWRSQAWPEGVYSIVRFELAPEGKGTKLVFDQAGHPDGCAGDARRRLDQDVLGADERDARRQVAWPWACRRAQIRAPDMCHRSYRARKLLKTKPRLPPASTSHQ